MSESRLTDATSFSKSQNFSERSPQLHDSKETPRESGNASNSNESEPSDLGAIGQQAVSQAQEQAVKIVSQAREQVTANVTSHTARAAGIAGVLATALQDAGKQLREQDDAAAAQYVDQAADQIVQISTMIEEQNVGQLVATVQGYARRQPALFFTAAVLVGIVGTRFLKSSSAASTSSGMGPDAYAGVSSPQRSSGRQEESYA